MKPKQFWTWFQDNQEKIYILPLLTKEEQNDLYYWLKKHLDYYCKGLGFKISFAKDYHGTATLAITAYGVKELFPKVIELVEAAPKVDNWKFEAFIKEKENQNLDHPYKFGNLEINVKDLSFQPVKYIKSTGKIIIHIYFDKKNPSSRRDRRLGSATVTERSRSEGGESNPMNNKALNIAITFILEDLLGEVLLYSKIKKFKLYKNKRNRSITYKLTHLKIYLSLLNQN